MAKGNVWVEDELSFLKKNFTTALWSVIISELPGRAKASIKAKASQLGLKRAKSARPKNNDSWDDSETKVVKELYPTVSWAQILEQLPSRSKRSIVRRARQLKLKRPVGGHVKGESAWSNEEIEVLEKNFANCLQHEIEKLLPNRTKEAVHAKVTKLGLKKLEETNTRTRNNTSSTWSEKEKQIVKDKFPCCLWEEILASLPHRTKGAIRRVAHEEFGIKRSKETECLERSKARKGVPQNWSTEQRKAAGKRLQKANLGREFSKETRTKISERQKGEGNSMYGKSLPPKSILKFKKSLKKAYKERGDEIRAQMSEAQKKVWLDPEHKVKMSKIQKESWTDERKAAKSVEMKKKFAEDTEYAKKILKIFSNVYHSPRSGLSERVKQHLPSSFKSEQYIEQFRVDEVDEENKITLEVYGDYWHANPNVYQPNAKINRGKMFIPAEEVWKLDKKREQCLESKGYRVVIVWQKDWKEKGPELLRELGVV